jgi:hypothetical protein
VITEEDDDDEDDDDATYGEHGKHRAIHMLKEEVQSFIGDESHIAASPSDEHTSNNTRGGHNGAATSTAKQHPTKRGAAALGAGGVGAGIGSAAAGQSVVKGAKGGARRQPPKKKGRASEPSEADSALISFGGDDDSFSGGDVDVEEMDAGVLRSGDGRLYDMRGAEDVDVDNGSLAASSDDQHHEKTTAKRKGKLAGRGRGRGHGGAK